MNLFVASGNFIIRIKAVASLEKAEGGGARDWVHLETRRLRLSENFLYL